MISSAAKTLTLPDFQSDCRALYACRMSFAKFAEEKIPEISAIQDAFAVRAHAIQPNAGTGAFAALTDEQKFAYAASRGVKVGNRAMKRKAGMK